MSKPAPSSALVVSLTDWLWRMSEAGVPYQARALAIYAALFDIDGNDALACACGMDLSGRADKTFFHWKNLLISNGWLVSTSPSGRGAKAKFMVAYGQRFQLDGPSFCPPELRMKTKIAFDYTCQGCGFRCPPKTEIMHKGRIVNQSYLQVDRITLGASCGAYIEENVTLLCRDCNSRRQDSGDPTGVPLASVLNGGQQ